MPSGEGKGGTLVRAHSFKLRQELDELSFIEQIFRTKYIWRLKQKDAPYNRHDKCLLVFQFLRMKGVTPFIRSSNKEAKSLNYTDLAFFI